jgi:hypothetical protein
MNKRIPFSTLILLLGFLVASAVGSATYTYRDQNWGAIQDAGNTAFPDCNGQKQSPINIVTANVVSNGVLERRFWYNTLHGFKWHYTANEGHL